MTLDKSQPWHSNPVIKNRILKADRPLMNPVMEAYRQEFLAMALVPKPFSNVSRR